MQVFALYQAILYGIMYLTLATYAQLWTIGYGQSSGITGLHYLSLGMGFTLGSQIGARLLDVIYRKLKAQNGGVGNPEMRMPLLAGTSLTLPLGLVLYGWSAEKHWFWLLPDLGGFIFSFGIMGCFLGLQSYLVDHYGIYSASAIAAVSSFRSLAGFRFPLFSNAMFSKLDLGWGNSLLALMALIVGCPSPWIFYTYGSRLRQWSKKPAFEGGK
ncbi:hypothetical protein FRC03_007355 [Tulasnella sp. 419]|nr:hypothetical protein FRC03_007355 [Tulasnella sp. 419]